MADKKYFLKDLANRMSEIEDNHFFLYKTWREMTHACKEVIPKILDDVGGNIENLNLDDKWAYTPYDKLDTFMVSYGVPVASFTKGKHSFVIWMNYADVENDDLSPNLYCVRSIPGSGKVEILNPATRGWDDVPNWGEGVDFSEIEVDEDTSIF